MKIKVGDLRKMIKEEYLRGVPEFQLQEEVRKMVDGIKKHIMLHVSRTTNSPESQRNASKAADDAMNDLQKEVFKFVEEKVWQFIQNS